MKKLIPWLPLFALCLAFGAERIQWRFHDTEILTIRRGETRLELGLRDDGVVVWREITAQPATVTTNSPAERPQVWFQGVPIQTFTNLQFTPYSDGIYWNFPLRDYLTNNIIPL